MTPEPPRFTISKRARRDIAAGAVLVSAIAAALIGSLTLAPYLAVAI